MVGQNSYGPIQLCPKCGNPLEKARTHNRRDAKCQKCQKEHANERQRLVREGKLIVNKRK